MSISWTEREATGSYLDQLQNVDEDEHQEERMLDSGLICEPLNSIKEIAVHCEDIERH